ncbi:hypothetical protein Trydic_g23692 [Trypoxylus dichotomus]
MDLFHVGHKQCESIWQYLSNVGIESFDFANQWRFNVKVIRLKLRPLPRWCKRDGSRARATEGGFGIRTVGSDRRWAGCTPGSRRADSDNSAGARSFARGHKFPPPVDVIAGRGL